MSNKYKAVSFLSIVEKKKLVELIVAHKIIVTLRRIGTQHVKIPSKGRKAECVSIDIDVRSILSIIFHVKDRTSQLPSIERRRKTEIFQRVKVKEGKRTWRSPCHSLGVAMATEGGGK